MGTSRITTESIAAESFILCANLCWQQCLMNEHVSKNYSKSRPKAGKYWLKTRRQKKRYLQYLKNSKINQQQPSKSKPTWKKTCYKVDGYFCWITTPSTKRVAAEPSNLCASLCWQPMLITASSYWVNFPNVAAGVDPFLAQISTPNGLVPTIWSWKHTKSHVAQHVIEPWKPLQVTMVNLHVPFLFEARTKSIEIPYCKLPFGSFFDRNNFSKNECYDATPARRHRLQNRGSQRVHSPEAKHSVEIPNIHF